MTLHASTSSPGPSGSTAEPPAAATVLRQVGALGLLTWPALGGGVDAAVTARAGGVSSGPYATLNLSLTVGDDPADVLENRRRAAAAMRADPGDFVFARQVHGAGVRVVTEADRGRGAGSQDDAIPDTDALVTASPRVVLAILTADCVPIVLHDPVTRQLACVHAGWRGTVAKVAAEAVAVMRGFGADPADIVAGLGPAMDPARYQVGPEVHEAVTGAFGPLAPDVIQPDPAVPGARDGRWLFDLWTANRLVLREAGLADEHVYVTATPTGGGQFFSDREARPCGRLALIARLRTEPEGAR